MKKAALLTPFLLLVLLIACRRENQPSESYPAVTAAFGSNIDLENLANYAAQTRPAYIMKDNSGANPITNAKATLGRVLFYDKNLSINNTISCASCHRQEFAFSDTAIVSKGVEGGVTVRHSMRLVNSRFGTETRFFWNERAATLEQQSTEPIKDHAEMGFSGQNGRPAFSAVLPKLQAIGYYKELFRFVYGDETVTETRLQECLAQFIRSIQSFDSRYDVGRTQVPADGPPFPNFTAQENQGKQLFLARPAFGVNGIRTGGGAGCASCHLPPEFDIDPNSRNNGITAVIGGGARDLGNTRSPSLRDLTRADGTVNSPMMHTGSKPTLRSVIAHYNLIDHNPAQNPNIDPRLTPGGVGQNLNLTTTEIDALVAFMQTLAGNAVYTDKRWGNPFLQ